LEVFAARVYGKHELRTCFKRMAHAYATDYLEQARSAETEPHLREESKEQLSATRLDLERRIGGKKTPLGGKRGLVGGGLPKFGGLPSFSLGNVIDSSRLSSGVRNASPFGNNKKRGGKKQTGMGLGGSPSMGLGGSPSMGLGGGKGSMFPPSPVAAVNIRLDRPPSAMKHSKR